jgi:hypothetical protein
MATAAGVAAVGTDLCWLIFDWIIKPLEIMPHSLGYGPVGLGLISSAVMGWKAVLMFQDKGHAQRELQDELAHRRQVHQVSRYRDFERRVREITDEDTPKRRRSDRLDDPTNERRQSGEPPAGTPRRRRTDR